VTLDSGEVRHMTPDEKNVAFFSKPVWKRAAIVFAGPGINYLFAIIILSVLYMTVGRPVTPPVVSGIEISSAAEKAQFKPHDVVTSINGEPIDSFDAIRRKVMLTLNEEITFGVKRGGEDIVLRATPEKLSETDRFGFVHERGYLGLIGPANGIDVTQISSVNGVSTKGDVAKAQALIRKNLDKNIVISTEMASHTQNSDKEGKIIIHPPKEMNADLGKEGAKEATILMLGVKPGDEVVHYNPVKAVGVAINETYRITVETFKAIGQMITGTRSAKELGGIIRIGAMAGDMAERGYISLIVFTALLSINLGMINLFPIPMLDGGHLLFYGLEAMRGKPVSERIQEYAFHFGLVILVTLMVFSNLNDVLQMFVFSKNS
jgi:regulator of sigma E protease